MSDSFTGTDRFVVRRRLGTGGMGAVYQAHDRETGSEVAIKVLQRAEPGHIQRFKNEFRRLADLQHPNLVRLGELFHEDELWFFTMELVLGSDFLHYTRPLPPDLQPFDEPRLRAAMRQLALGTAALHAEQIVHRDIKPSNVMAASDGRVVLLDFGLATPVVGEAPPAGDNLVGTFAYMAPEQAAGKAASPSADWYSVGVVLYEALTGRLPFAGTGLEVLMNKQRFEPPPPRQVLPQVPADLDALCAALLRFDPARRPSGGEILQRLGVLDEPGRTPAGSRPSRPTPATELVGREDELACIEAWIEAREADETRLISLRGASGVGKSVLAHEAATRFAGRYPDALVLASRCYERESLPFKAFDGLVDGLSQALSALDQVDAALLLPPDAALIARLFPSLRQVPAMGRVAEPRLPNPQELRKRAFRALRQLFLRLGEKRPLLLGIDDFQWVDPDSLALLAEVLRGPGGPPLVVLTTERDGFPTWNPPEGCAHRMLELANLDAVAARKLAQQLLNEASRADLDVDAIFAETKGHPLFIQELVRHATAGSRGREKISLDDALRARIAELEPPAQRLLEILSVASGPLPQKAAFLAAELSGSEAQRWSALLRVARLARTAGSRDLDRIEPYHDRVRESVLAHLPAEVARDHHRRIAIGLEGVGGATRSPEALVFHLAASGDGERARTLAVRAGENAEHGLAFDRAARFYLQAIELGHPETSALWTRRGEALANAGRGRAAADAFLAAATSAGDAASALEARRRAAEQLLMSGHIADGMATLQTVLAAIGVTLPATSAKATFSLLVRRAKLRLRGLRFRVSDGSDVSPQALRRVDIFASVAKALSLVDPLRGADFQARHLVLALRSGEPARIARALSLEAGYSAVSNERGGERAARVLGMAEQLGDRTSSPWAGAIVTGTWGLVHYQRGRWKLALEACELAEKRMREQCTGVAWELDTVRFFTLYTLVYLGELRELAARVPDYLRDAEERGDLYGATNVRVGWPNAAWLVRGDLAGARAALDHAAHDWTPEGFHVQHYHQMLGRAHVALYGDDAAAAWAGLEASWPAYTGSFLRRVESVRIEAGHLRARCALALAVADLRRRDELVRVARSSARQLLGEEAGWGRAVGRLIAASCDAVGGNLDRARSRLAGAVRELEAHDMGAYAALAAWSLARLQGGNEAELGESQGRRWAELQGLREPERWRAMLVPGL